MKNKKDKYIYIYIYIYLLGLGSIKSRSKVQFKSTVGAHHTSFRCMWLKLSPSPVHILEVLGVSFSLVYFVDTSGHILVHSI